MEYVEGYDLDIYPEEVIKYCPLCGLECVDIGVNGAGIYEGEDFVCVNVDCKNYFKHI